MATLRAAERSYRQNRYTRRSFLKAAGALAVTGALSPLFSAPSTRAASFAGQTVEILVPFAEGGATDVGARFLAPFLERYLPGNPRVRIRNMPGGGSIQGANYFEANARPDGLLVLCTTSSTSFPYMLGQQGVNYDLSNKRVAMTLPFGLVVYTSPETGIQDASQLKQSRQPLVYGGIGATASDMPVLLALELLELDFRAVLGFSGRGPIRLAFERGETNLDFQFTPVYLSQVVDLVRAGRAVPLMTGGAINPQTGTFIDRDPVVADLPSVYEVYRTLYGRDPSGPAWDAFQAASVLTLSNGLTWFLHEDTPAEILEAWYQAVGQIMNDPEYHQRGESITGGYPLYPGHETEAAMRRALDPEPHVRDWLIDLLSTKYQVRF